MSVSTWWVCHYKATYHTYYASNS